MASYDYMKATNTKRFVIEDSITKVTSDGEPHEMMTMIAVVSGLLTAVVILVILFSLIACRKNIDEENQSDSGSTARSSTLSTTNESITNSKRSSIMTIYQPHKFSYETRDECICKQSLKKRNLEGNLNVAFEGNEFPLKNNSMKSKKKTHWSDEIIEEIDKLPAPKDTSVIIEEKF